jgi:hypothetical protein
MLDYIKSRFKSLRDLLKWFKTATTASIMRFFNTRQKYYDDLIKRATSFENVITAGMDADGVTVIDVSGDSTKSKRKVDHNAKETIRTKDGTVLPVEGFHMPNRVQLAKDNKLVDELEGAVNELEGMIVRLGNLKDRTSRSMVKSMKDYRKEMSAKLDGVLEALEGLSDKHMPSLLNSLAGSLYNHINETLPSDSYDDLGWEVYVTSHDSLTNSKDAPVEFTYYVHIDGLDKEVFKNEQFILAITGEITETKGRGRAPSKYSMTVFINSLLKFARPGHFDKGDRVNGANLSNMKRNLQSQAHKLLSLHGLGPAFGKKRVGITQQALRHSPLMDMDGISDLNVYDGEILIELSATDEQLIQKEMWPNIIAHLNNLVRRLRGASWTYTLDKEGRKRTMRIVRVQG